ncbi:MAG TPA: hypothetical protein VKZ79_16695 [Alphaproteobacteria bacterium]|nr:hypothetical protein [Alphaproteobacteria bacterium]
MDPALKNLREWVALLFVLFLVLDLAGLQYGLHLAQSSPLEPEPALGAVWALVQGQRGSFFNIYVTEAQRAAYFGLLGAAGLSLLATLTLIVVHGIRQVKPERARGRRNRR